MATVNRNIQYLNRDFNSFRNQLIEFAKTYFPNTYNDFTPASPGMLFMEQASYVGDVLSFYLDNQFQETFVQYATEIPNLFNLAYMLGYKPKVTTPATALIDIYQRVPALSNAPDYSYGLIIPQNTALSTNQASAISFLTQTVVDFTVSSSLNPTTATVYEVDSFGVPTSYLLKKSVKAISATVNTTTFSFTSPQDFATVTIPGQNIIGILDIVDSDGNKWYEVDALGQELIYDSIRNTNPNDPTELLHSDAPYLLQTKQVQRRYTSRFLDESTLQLQFGAGTVGDFDEELIPNPDNVGLGLLYEQQKLTTAFSPTNFIFTSTYGIAPTNTTLTVRYLTGGGVESNVNVGSIVNITPTNVVFSTPNLNPVTATQYFSTLEVYNSVAASGGSDGDSIEEIRQNTLASFQNQLRTVTADDYLIRAMSMPGTYGTVAKAFAQPEKLSDMLPGEQASSVQLYVLGYNADGTLANVSETIKNNLKTYLTQFRTLNDTVKIKDAFIINIGVDFDIITYPNYNNNQVLAQCVTELQKFFKISNWQINEPIILRDLYVLLDNVDGVQTVKDIVIVNKTGTANGYSDYAYDIQVATNNKVIYPSQDPMIFEVKYPDVDIRGRVVPL